MQSKEIIKQYEKRKWPSAEYIMLMPSAVRQKKLSIMPYCQRL